MDTFIEVIDSLNNSPVLVNLSHVEEIRNTDGHAVIYYAFQGAEMIEQDHITCKENYETIKCKIWR